MKISIKSKRAFFRFLPFAAIILALTAVLLLCGLIPCEKTKQILQSVIFVCYCWVFISIIYHYARKTGIVIVLFLALFVSGLYYFDEESPHSFVRNINKSFSMLLGRGYVKEAPDLLPYVYFLSHLLFATFAFSLFGRRLMNRNGYFLIPQRYRNIFWGYNEGGILLANDMLNNDLLNQAAFVLSSSIDNKGNEDKAIFEKIDRMGAIALYWNSDSKKLPAGQRHFFLSDDPDFNIKMALKLVKYLKKKSVKNKTHLFVRAETEYIDSFFAYELDGVENIEIHLFNKSDLTARCFIRDYPMLNAPEIEIDHEKLLVKGDFNLLLAGFGKAGQELLKKCICDAQFLNSAFKATVIDKEIDTKYGDFPVLYNECIDAYKISFASENIAGSRQFYEWIEGNVASFNRIIITLGNDRVNINIAMKIARILHDKGKSIDETKRMVFAHVRHKSQFAPYGNPAVSPISIFGDVASIYTQNIVIHEEMDRIAKMVNYVYNCYLQDKVETIDWQKAEELWSKTTLFHKNSSRASAMNMRNTDRIIKGKWDALTPEKLEILSENEHLRWNAFHYVSGIRKWALDEIPAGHPHDAKLRDSKGNLLKHACLVDYAELQKVTDKINENRKINQNPIPEDFLEADRRIVRHIPLFLLTSSL